LSCPNTLATPQTLNHPPGPEARTRELHSAVFLVRQPFLFYFFSIPFLTGQFHVVTRDWLAVWKVFADVAQDVTEEVFLQQTKHTDWARSLLSQVLPAIREANPRKGNEQGR
jgi:hypothetical protein